MQNNKGGFTDDQNKALINKALGVSGGKDGSFLIQGIFDAKGTPAQENLQKAYETLEKRIQQTTSKDKKNRLMKMFKKNICIFFSVIYYYILQ
ncbi:MAG: hypothetical protein IPJ81_08445 [Chitinophagaceae bacterium]|nr:hypothetical protein [Chitinophagaceae bacterium]